MGAIKRCDFRYTEEFNINEFVIELSAKSGINITTNEIGDIICKESKSKLYVENINSENLILVYDSHIEPTYLFYLVNYSIIQRGGVLINDIILPELEIDCWEKFSRKYNSISC